MNIQITVLVNHFNTRESTQNNSRARGIGTAMREYYSDLGHLAEMNEIVIEKALEKQGDLQINESYGAENAGDLGNQFHFVIGAGESAIDAFLKVPLRDDCISFIWSGDKIYQKLTDNIDWLDFVTLPAYAFVDKDGILDRAKREVLNRECSLIETTDLPHNHTSAEFQEAYEKARQPGGFLHNFSAEESYVFFILGGSVLDQDGRQRSYSEEELERLAEHLFRYSNSVNCKICIMTDPTAENHFQSINHSSIVYSMLESLTAKLKIRGMQFDSDFYVFDSCIEHHGVNVYDALVGAALNVDSDMWVAGELAHQLPELTRIAPKHLIIFKTSLMNGMHEAHVEAMWEAGECEIVDSKKFKACRESERGGQLGSAAEIIAQRVATQLGHLEPDDSGIRETSPTQRMKAPFLPSPIRNRAPIEGGRRK